MGARSAQAFLLGHKAPSVRLLLGFVLLRAALWIPVRLGVDGLRAEALNPDVFKSGEMVLVAGAPFGFHRHVFFHFVHAHAVAFVLAIVCFMAIFVILQCTHCGACRTEWPPRPRQAWGHLRGVASLAWPCAW